MKNFEENLKRLEELSDAIRSSDITLEDALKSFEEGIKLAKGMEKELDNIEGKIQILMNTPSNEIDEDENLPESDEKKKRTTKSKKTKDSEEDFPVLDLFTPNTEINGTRNG